MAINYGKGKNTSNYNLGFVQQKKEIFSSALTTSKCLSYHGMEYVWTDELKFSSCLDLHLTVIISH